MQGTHILAEAAEEYKQGVIDLKLKRNEELNRGEDEMLREAWAIHEAKVSNKSFRREQRKGGKNGKRVGVGGGGSAAGYAAPGASASGREMKSLTEEDEED